MESTIKCAVLLLFATSVAAAPGTSNELLTVRTVKVRSSRSKAAEDQAAVLRQKLDEIIPSLIPDTSDEADLIIDYEEYVTGSSDAEATAWRATLYHLACQSRDFGEPPSRIVRGQCENNVFVRVGMGKMSGVVAPDRSGAEDFAYLLRDAILGLAPATTAPVPPVPVAPLPFSVHPQPVNVNSNLIISGSNNLEGLTFEPSSPPQSAP